MGSEWKKLQAALVDAGFVIKPNKGHYKIYKGNSYLVTLPGSPSDHATWNNTLGCLRRHADFDYRPKQTRKKKDEA